MTLFRKSLLTLGSAAFFLASILIISVLVFMNSLYYETNSRALSNTTAALFSVFSENTLGKYFADGIKGRAFPFDNNQYRLTLIAVDGEVLWDSRVEQRMVNHLDREEIRAALEGREGRALRDSLSAGIRTLYTALPVKNADGTVAGVFRLSVEVPSFWQRIAPAAFPFMLLASALVFAAFIGVYYFSRSLSLSFDRLVDIALEAGDFRYTDTDLGETEEILTLEKALRSMSSGLKLALGEARTESRRLETILNSMSEAVIAMDTDLFLLLINPCARKLFNLESQNSRKISLLEATHSTELEWTARKVLESGKAVETEITLHNGGGMERRFYVSVSPLPLASSSPSEPSSPSAVSSDTVQVGGIVMVMEERTHIIRLEQIRKDFVANVSHELRTPIQLIKGFSETALDSPFVAVFDDDSTGKDSAEGDSDKKKQFRHFLEIIRSNAGTMENLINDLLSLASLEDETGVRLVKEELELAPLFAEAVSSVTIQAAKKQIGIKVDCQQDLKAKLYGSLIIQVFVNLLDNAIKYSPDASQVVLRAFRHDAELVLEVKDQGIGIPAEHQERIFERFYRVDRARSREQGGTGLGLSIVRHIVLLHGGRVEVESHAGEGSLFRVIIPDTLPL